MFEEKINLILEKMEEIDERAFSIGKEKLEENDLKLWDSSHRQLEILSAIMFEDINTGTELAKAMHLNKSTVSLVLSKMEKKELIVRVRGQASDNRLTYIESTEKGERLLTDFFIYRLKNFKAFYDFLTDECRQYFSKGVTYLRSIAGDVSPHNDKMVAFIFENYNEHLGDFGSELLQLSRDLIYFLSIFLNYGGSFRDKIKKIELTPAQTRIMVAMLKCNISSLTELEKQLKTSASALSICVSRLEAKGYVEKSQLKNNGDARRKYLTLTHKGMEILIKEKEKHRDVTYNFLADLSLEQLDIFDKAMDYIGMALKDL